MRSRASSIRCLQNLTTIIYTNVQMHWLAVGSSCLWVVLQNVNVKLFCPQNLHRAIATPTRRQSFHQVEVGFFFWRKGQIVRTPQKAFPSKWVVIQPPCCCTYTVSPRHNRSRDRLDSATRFYIERSNVRKKNAYQAICARCLHTHNAVIQEHPQINHSDLQIRPACIFTCCEYTHLGIQMTTSKQPTQTIPLQAVHMCK